MSAKIKREQKLQAAVENHGSELNVEGEKITEAEGAGSMERTAGRKRCTQILFQFGLCEDCTAARKQGSKEES